MNIFDDYGNFIEEHESLIDELKNSSSVIMTLLNDVIKVLDYVYEQYLAQDKIEEELIDIFDIGFGYLSNIIFDVNTYYKDYCNSDINILNRYGTLITYSKYLEDFKYYLEDEEILTEDRKQVIDNVLNKIDNIIINHKQVTQNIVSNFENEIEQIIPYNERFKPVYSVFLMICEELNIF